MAASKYILGQTIKQHREEQDMPQQELANRIGCDRQYLWKVENGKINMSMDYLDNIIEKLGSSPEEFHSRKFQTNK